MSEACHHAKFDDDVNSKESLAREIHTDTDTGIAYTIQCYAMQYNTISLYYLS